MSPLDAETLQKHINASLAIIPKEHKQALVAYANTNKEWHLAYANRVNENWVLGVHVGRTQISGVQGDVVIQWSK